MRCVRPKHKEHDKTNMRTAFLEMMIKKVMIALNVQDLDEETIGMVERMAVLMVETKHISSGSASSK